MDTKFWLILSLVQFCSKITDVISANDTKNVKEAEPYFQQLYLIFSNSRLTHCHKINSGQLDLNCELKNVQNNTLFVTPRWGLKNSAGCPSLSACP